MLGNNAVQTITLTSMKLFINIWYHKYRRKETNIDKSTFHSNLVKENEISYRIVNTTHIKCGILWCSVALWWPICCCVVMCGTV